MRACGAAAVLDYSKGDVFAKVAAEAAAQGPWDFVLDCVSSADARDQATQKQSKRREQKHNLAHAAQPSQTKTKGRFLPAAAEL